MNFKDLTKVLNKVQRDKLVFIGLGNPQCGDDAAGKILLERLAHRKELVGAHFMFTGTTPENYLTKITEKEPDAVIFIDTARFNPIPGKIELLDERNLSPTDFSTHTFSIEMIAAYITSFRPCRIFYLGIEPKSTEMHQPLSKSVLDGIDAFFKDQDVK
jgi:hydrogenase maturation protease